MNRTFWTIIRIVLVGTFALALAVVLFGAGFGSAYLLTGTGALPAIPLLAPPEAPPAAPPQDQPPTPPPAIETVAPTPTPVPIPTPMSEDQETFQLFWEVWGLVQRDFYGELPDMQTLTYAAIRGMLITLGDEYTAFIEPDIATILAEDATGQFEGIGAYVDLNKEGKLELIGIFEGGPAERAGLLEGDRVLAVDGVSLVGRTLYESISLIRGPAGSEATLLIEREGVAERFEVPVTRARLEIPVVEFEMRDDGVGYIRLHDFSTPASDRLQQALQELLEQEPRGIILDLRSNPGGWLEQAIAVADLFLDDGAILVERWSDGTEHEFTATPGQLGEDVSLVVLVDGGTASAAEIVAGALQDRERAILIGQTTFGKGSVQRPFTLSDGSELRVTTALWFTPDKQVIQGVGLTPDIDVPWPEEGLEPDQDPQLERAVQHLLTGE